MATLFARREAKTRIRQCDWLKLAGEKIRREQVGSVPTFLSIRANKVAKRKIGFNHVWGVKPIFHLATLFARREAKTRIRQRDWLKLAGEKFRREQV